MVAAPIACGSVEVRLKPKIRRRVAASLLAFCLEGIVTQTLLPKRTGRGRAMAAEILVCTPAIRALIRDDKIHQIYSMMQSGKKYGMQTMNDALYLLYQSREVAWEDCVRASTDPVELARLCGIQLEPDGSAPTTEKKAAAGGLKK